MTNSFALIDFELSKIRDAKDGIKIKQKGRILEIYIEKDRFDTGIHYRFKTPAGDMYFTKTEEFPHILFPLPQDKYIILPHII